MLEMVHWKIKSTQYGNESPTISKYYKDISRNKTLTAEEEIALCMRIAQNDIGAFNQLICCNLKFVVSIAKQYQGKGLLLGDLISEGNFGLMNAVKRFDVSKGFKFISFAVWWIRESILKAIIEQSRTVKLPKNQIIAMSRIAKFSAVFEQKHERLPNSHEIAEAMNLDASKILDYAFPVNRALSLDAEIDKDNALSLMDLLGKECEELRYFIANDSLTHFVEDALRVLTRRERWLITRYLGLGQDEMQLEQIAGAMRLTKERVRQIKDEAFLKLRCESKLLSRKLNGL